MSILRLQKINTRRVNYFCIFFFTISGFVAAAVQDEVAPKPRLDQNSPAVWEFMEYDEFSKSALRIEVTCIYEGVDKCGHASGVIISVNPDKKHPTIEGMCRGHVITCAHVTPSNVVEVDIEYQNGMKEIATVLIRSAESDLALLETWVPTDFKAIQPAFGCKYGDVVRGCGYGLITDYTIPRYFECEVFRSSRLLIVLLEDAVPGDSGGPIFNSEGELLGLISCGITEFQYLNSVQYTGPCSGPSTIAIKNLLFSYALKIAAEQAEIQVEIQE